MPRRRVLTEAQLNALFALPTTEADLIRHYTLTPQDLAVIARRRRPHNRRNRRRLSCRTNPALSPSSPAA
jgi:hypothetical protein